MASRRTSESGAFMSQYDLEVEKEIKALKSQISDLKKELEDLKKAPAPAAQSSDSGKLDLLISILKRHAPLNIDKLSKGQL
jgi:50S ribosomal subunit-associated GTPase HflX